MSPVVGPFSGAGEEAERILEAYGEKLGVAFQLADDLLDITSDDSGKEPGTDLREGVDTLPVLYVKASTDPADARLQELLSSDLRTDAHTRQVAEEAQRVLDPLGDGEAVRALRALAASVVDREV